MNEFLLPGIVIGGAAALTPGPVFLVLIAETLRKGMRAGFAIAISPLILDLLFVPIAIIAGDAFRLYPSLLATLSFFGAGFLLYLGYKHLTVCSQDIQSAAPVRQSLVTGLMTDLLGPFLYLFWFSVGLPIFAKGNLAEYIVFASALSLSAVFGNVIMVLLVFRTRERFIAHVPLLIRILSIGLFLMAALFVREGVRYIS